MQVFLPYKDYVKSAKVIDNKRLWKQILEADGIIRIITGERTGYANHPVTKLWYDYPKQLKQYRDILIEEWFSRRLTTPPKIHKPKKVTYPPFVTPKFCRSHKDILLNKNKEHYSKYFK